MMIIYWLYIIYTYFRYKGTYLLEEKMLFAILFNAFILTIL
nr:MAG TPA: hypothetical protein [Caudoviricetes sp.]